MGLLETRRTWGSFVLITGKFCAIIDRQGLSSKDSTLKHSALRKRLLERDGWRCGIHVGGCGANLSLRETDIDHIVGRNVLKTNRKLYLQLSLLDGLLQPMHRRCNALKHGALFLDFKCHCHSVSASILNGKVQISVHYRDRPLPGFTLMLPATDRDGVLMVAGRSGSDIVGYRRQVFGGAFQSPFGDLNSGTLVFDPLESVSPPGDWIVPASGDREVEYEPDADRLARIRTDIRGPTAVQYSLIRNQDLAISRSLSATSSSISNILARFRATSMSQIVEAAAQIVEATSRTSVLQLQASRIGFSKLLLDPARQFAPHSDDLANILPSKVDKS